MNRKKVLSTSAALILLACTLLLTSTKGHADLFPAPGDEVLIFASGRDTGAEIWAVRPDGSDLTQITYNNWQDYFPYISPDGTQISTCRNQDGHAWLVVMTIRGTDERYVARTCTGGPYEWLDDDHVIMSTRPPGGGEGGLYSIDVNTGAFSLVDTGHVQPDHPTASQDGSRLAFAGQPWALYIQDVGSATPIVLANTPARFPKWSPDGTEIAYERYIGSVESRKVIPVAR